MKNGEYGLSEPAENIVTVYSDFMMRIAQFNELVSTGSQLLVSFQQSLGFLGRAPIDKTSKLVERTINTHGSRRVLSYFEAGCANSHDSLQNVSKCKSAYMPSWTQEHITKAKVVIDELEFFVGNAISVVQTSTEKDEDIIYNRYSCVTSNGQAAKENDEDISCNLDSCSTSVDQGRPNVAEYASIMAIIFNMGKQDFIMQGKIVLCSFELYPLSTTSLHRKNWRPIARCGRCGPL